LRWGFFSITNTGGIEKPVALRAVMAGWHHCSTLKGEKMSFYEKAAMIISVIMLVIAAIIYFQDNRD